MATAYKNALIDIDELRRKAAEGAANAQTTIASLPASAQAQVQSAVPLATRNLTDAQQQAQQKAAQMAAQVNASNPLSAGTGILKNEPVQKTSTVGNAYQQALATATPVSVTSSNQNVTGKTAAVPTAAPATVTPQQLNDYTWYNWMGRNDMTTMTDQDKSNWNAAMQGWQNGNYNAFNDNFQTNGNWASYVDDNGNVSGMLRYIGDGVGGYVPVNNGQLLYNGWSDRDYAFYGPNGEVYTADSSGRLTRTGTWTPEAQYSALEDSIPYKLLKGTATDAEREAWISQVNPTSTLQKAAAAGDQDAIEQIAQRAGVSTPSPQAQQTPAQQAISAYDRQYSSSTTAASQPAAQQQNTPVTSQNQSNMYVASPYKEYVDNWSYPDAPEWEGTEYERERDAALERAKNMQWNYDPNTDPVWQAYQKQYRREGQRATKEALAQAAGLTGGQMNSYAAQAASQAGNYYASQLSDRLPQLYQDAYQRYLQEFQRQLGISDQYEQQGQTEYNRYMDRLGQYNTNRSFDYGRYRDAVGDYRYADETAYDRQRDAIADQRYDQQWAQQLREYADSQNWKATEWQQYLREYGDKMSQQEREWAYQQYRDAVADEKYADETAYKRQMDAYDQAWNEEDRDYTRNWNENKYNDSMKMEALDYLNKNQIVTGIYADILGVPEGTTYEQYYSQFLGGGSSSPFDEGEVSNPGYDRTPPADTPRGEAKPVTEETPRQSDTQNADNLVPGVRHSINGQPMTKGFQEWWPTIRDAYDQGATASEIKQAIANLISQGIIKDYEKDVILSKLGIYGNGGR